MSIAEEIINGEICAICTMPFTETHGYPVECKECWEKGDSYQKAVFDTVNIEDNLLNETK